MVTAGEFLRLALHRWYVVLACCAITGGAVLSISHPASLYWSRATVVVVRPTTAWNPNTLQNQDPTTPAASALVLRINHGTTAVHLAAQDAPLYGVGIDAGVQIQVRNLGSQWQPQIQDPNIDIQVVDHTPEEAMARMDHIIAELKGQFAELQRDLGVQPARRMTLDGGHGMSVVEVVPNPKRAQLIAAILGGIGTVLCVRWSDRLLTRRRRPRSREAPARGGRDAARAAAPASAGGAR